MLFLFWLNFVILSITLKCVMCLTNIGIGNNSIDNSKALFEIGLDEKIAIEKLKDLTSDWLYLDYMKTDKYLIHWIRDSNLNPEKASRKIIAYHKFRKQNKIDNILNEDWHELETRFPFEIIDGVDIEGGIIITISMGKWDLRREVIGGKIDKIYRYLDYMFEKCVKSIYESRGINATVIIDMAGFSWKTHVCVQCVPLYPYIANILENHYPQSIKHLYMVNTPNYFRPAVDGIKLVLSTHTLKAIRIFDFDKSEWRAIVLEKIPANLLKPEFGGTKRVEQKALF